MLTKTVWNHIRKNKKKKHSPEADWRTIGVIGAGRHTGSTHLCIWLANYLTSVNRESTAVLEWNTHGDLKKMAEICVKGKTNYDSFRVMAVDYYVDADAEILADCMNRNYRRIILDYGESTKENLCECARCDKKVIIGALSEWQIEAFSDILDQKEKRDQSWCYAATFGSEENRREMEKAFFQKIIRIPISVDAFSVTRTDMDFFASFIK